MSTLKALVLIGVFLCHLTQARHVFSDDFLSFINSTLSRNDKEEHSGKNKTFCKTEACKTTAKAILDGLDQNVDPCEDFYSFVCGGWIQKHPVPPTENRWGQFDILDRKVDSQVHELLEEKYNKDEPEIVRKVKRIYQACMNIDRIERKGLTPLLDLLEEFNHWPMTTNKWNELNTDWQKLVSDVGRKLAIDVILFVYVDVDRKNTSRNILIVDEPNLEVPKYLLSQSEPSFLVAYLTFIVSAAELLIRARGDRVYMFNLHLQAFQVFKFEAELARIMRKDEEKRNAEDSFHLTTLRDLQNWTDERNHLNQASRINWAELLRNILGGDRKDLTDETPIAVTSWNYLERLMNLIDVTPPKVLANYILWRVVKKMTRDANSEMHYLNFSFRRELYGVTEDYPRWRDCVSTSNYLSFVVGYMYVQRHFTDEAKSKAFEMVERIRSAFREELLENPWMDDDSRKQAMEKAEVMNEFIGYPDWFNNITYLEEYYKGIEIGDDHLENKVRIREFLARKLMNNLKTETNREEWIASPAIANAFYNPHLNSIIFPAAVLQDPFFDKDQPEALNYGSIGSVVGHEITHAFDDTGRQSDKFGNIKHWWSKDTEKNYMRNALCFLNQYGNYRIPELDAVMNIKVTMDGFRTLDENIADNGGLSTALRAYLSHRKRTGEKDLRLPGLEQYSPEQLFYIGFARVWCESQTTASLLGEVLDGAHSPHRFRVTGAVSNSKHFATTWRCRLGSNMNPELKCKLW